MTQPDPALIQTFADLRRAEPAVAAAGRGVTTGRGHWPDAPNYSITFTAAAVLAPTLEDLDRYIESCTPQATHVAQLNQQAAYLLCGITALGLIDEEQNDQLLRLERHVKPVQIGAPPRAIPKDILAAPAGPVVQAALDLLKRAGAAGSQKTTDTRKAELRMVVSHLYSHSLLIEHFVQMPDSPLGQYKETFDPAVQHRAVLALASSGASPSSAQDFKGLNRKRQGALITPAAVQYIGDVDVDGLLKAAQSLPGQ